MESYNKQKSKYNRMELQNRQKDKYNYNKIKY